jgi:hypothetical protein
MAVMVSGSAEGPVLKMSYRPLLSMEWAQPDRYRAPKEIDPDRVVRSIPPRTVVMWVARGGSNGSPVQNVTPGLYPLFNEPKNTYPPLFPQVHQMRLDAFVTLRFSMVGIPRRRRTAHNTSILMHS